MKVVAINGGPRIGWNTDMLIDEAIKGAESKGATVEKFNLYKLDNFKGCISCFGCKKDANKGKCICNDGLKPVLDAARDADALIMGAPNYISDFAAQFKLFFERLIFENVTYRSDITTYNKKMKPILLIMSCNAPGSMYEDLLFRYRNMLNNIVGPTETLLSSETLQVSDYSKYDWTIFDPNQRKIRRETIFPEDLRKAYDRGAELV